MKHAIDHLVLCVNDLDEARGFYERLGFTLTPLARHPFGTANHLAQLEGNFLEILAVVDPARIPKVPPGEFGFGAFNAAFVAKRQGMSTLVLPSDDARGDQRAFAARGLDTYAPFDFARAARLPDGGSVTVSFSLAFVTSRDMPDAVFFTCQQHAPQYFWKAEYQRHANGARAIVEVLMIAEAPARLADFYGKLLGPGLVRKEGDGLRLALEGSSLAILTPGQFKARYPAIESPESGAGPHFAGYRVAVADLPSAEAILSRNQIPFRRSGGRLQIVPADAFGTLIEFAAAGDAL
ncbi:MAG: VOC family protein [Alphaproteobacteria bacterium]